MGKDMKEKEYDMILLIKKKWFEMILSGEKKEEYRENKKYYRRRLENIFNTNILNSILKQGYGTIPFKVLFRNGYNQNSPSFVATVKLRLGFGKPEWGAEEGKLYYVLSIIRIEEKEGDRK